MMVRVIVALVMMFIVMMIVPMTMFVIVVMKFCLSLHSDRFGRGDKVAADFFHERLRFFHLLRCRPALPLTGERDPFLQVFRMFMVMLNKMRKENRQLLRDRIFVTHSFPLLLQDDIMFHEINFRNIVAGKCFLFAEKGRNRHRSVGFGHYRGLLHDSVFRRFFC
jgi:hypothetical protein